MPGEALCRHGSMTKTQGSEDKNSRKYVQSLRCCYNAVQYILIIYTVLQWLMQNIHKSLYSQKTPHGSLVTHGLPWAVYCDKFGDNGLCNNGTALHLANQLGANICISFGSRLSDICYFHRFRHLQNTSAIGPFHKGLWAHNQNLSKIMFARILITMIQSCHTLTHACCHAVSGIDKIKPAWWNLEHG